MEVYVSESMETVFLSCMVLRALLLAQHQAGVLFGRVHVAIERYSLVLYQSSKGQSTALFQSSRTTCPKEASRSKLCPTSNCSLLSPPLYKRASGIWEAQVLTPACQVRCDPSML